MSFLAPLFAIGLAALAIPILVHLVHKERKETTPFPSLMFLLRTPYQHSRRQRIRDWLLFLTRAMVFLLLVAAFARPVFERPPDAAAAGIGGGREVVILLDRSFSMRVGDRWSRAQAALARRSTRLGPNDTRHRDPLRRPGARGPRGRRQPCGAACDRRQRCHPATPLRVMRRRLLLARRTVADSKLPKREVIVISDFQRSGWDVGEDARLPAGTTVTPVDVASDERRRSRRARGRIASIDGGRSRAHRRDRPRFPTSGRQPVASRRDWKSRVAWWRRTRLDLGADAGGVVTFESLAIPESPQQAAIRITPDDVPGDDVLHFIMERAPSIPVLVVETCHAGADPDIYLQRALEIGDRPSFDITMRRSHTAVGGRPRRQAAGDHGQRAVARRVTWVDGSRRLSATGGGLLVVAGDAVTGIDVARARQWRAARQSGRRSRSRLRTRAPCWGSSIAATPRSRCSAIRRAATCRRRASIATGPRGRQRRSGTIRRRLGRGG